MGGKANNFSADLVLKTRYNCNSNDHDCQSQTNPKNRNIKDGAGYALSPVSAENQFFGNKDLSIHKAIA